MKILCIAPEHSDVLAATSTLPELSPDISLSWAQRFEDAAFWIFHNRDLAALVLDAKFGHEPCAALLANLHKRGLGAPTIVVADQASSTPSALGLGPDDCLLPRSTLVRDLPAAISRLIDKRQPVRPERDVLKAQLARAEAALREADGRHAVEIRAGDDRLADRERVLAAEIATLAASHQALERRCVEAEAAVQAAAEQLARLDSEWREALARELTVRQAVEAALSRVERDRAEVNGAHAAALAELGIRLREQETRVEAERSSSQAARAHLQQQLDDAMSARRALEELITRERSATEAREMQLKANLEAGLTAARDERLALEARLAHVAAEIDEARARHATEASAAADRFAERERAFAIRMAELVAARDTLDALCATVQAAREAERTRAARDAEAAAAEADARERALSERLRQEIALREDAERIRTSLERTRAEDDALHTTLVASSHALESRCANLSDRCAELDARCGDLTARRDEAEAALFAQREAAATHAAALAAAMEQVAERDACLARERTTAQAAHATLAQQLETAVRTRDEAEQSAVRARQSAAERLAEREQVLGQHIEELSEHVKALRDQIADVVAARDVLAQRLSDADAALRTAQTQAAQDATTAAARAAERQREFEAAHTAALAALADLEQRLRAAEDARRSADESAARDRLAAEAQIAELRIELEATQLEGAAAQRALQERLASAMAASEEAKTMHAATMSDAAEQSAAREQALNAQLADAVAEHVHSAREASTRERTLQESIAAEIDKRQAVERALEEATRSHEAAAVAHAARLQTDLDAELQRAEDERGRLEARIGSLETASRDAARQHADAMAAIVAEADRQRLQLDTQIGERIAQLDALGADLTAREAACRRLQDELSARDADIERLRRREAELRSEVDAESSARVLVERERDDRTKAHQELVHRLDQEKNELLASLTAAREESARLLRGREEISSSFAASQQEVERLRVDLTASTRDGAAMREERDTLKIEAGRANQLQRDLDRLRIETDRDFNQHPLPLLRCDLDGTLTQANHAFARMVEHASADDAQRLALATELFKASNDLRWLVERSRTAGVVTQTESTLRIRDGRCLVVRLMSSATPRGAQVVVQDLAPQRAAQSTLDQARRLEAVGRLGIEVAMASSHLLRDVCRDGERWLSAFDGTRAMRRRVELLLDDVARAAGHLDQLTTFGEQQANAIPSVDLHRVLTNMAPVLRRIAGDEIEIQLPSREEGAPAYEVDVEANRVERLLVNVASYGRDRMPAGGSMRFELAPTVVDRAFIEKHPAVRLGPHVVLTVAEVHGPIRAMAPSTCEELAIAHDDESVPSGGVGVDLTALQALVRGCEGHLWIDAAACGDLTIRIHLPLKVA